MEQLPIELLSHIFSFIKTKDLFPSCFLISSICLKAIKDEVVWEQRCNNELAVFERVNETSSWLNTFQGNYLFVFNILSDIYM